MTRWMRCAFRCVCAHDVRGHAPRARAFAALWPRQIRARPGQFGERLARLTPHPMTNNCATCKLAAIPAWLGSQGDDDDGDGDGSDDEAYSDDDDISWKVPACDVRLL